MAGDKEGEERGGRIRHGKREGRRKGREKRYEKNWEERERAREREREKASRAIAAVKVLIGRPRSSLNWKAKKQEERVV